MRSRNIKPGFFENEELSSLPPIARILFAGLWCYADKEGRFEWRPKRIKAVILPYDDCDIDKLLMSLHAMSFIYIYRHGTETYGLIPNFHIHQNPHPHEAKSKLPIPPENIKEIQCHGIDLQCNEMSPKCTADSLIPDSLIPDLKEGDKSPLDPIKKTIWDVGVRLLVEAGATEKNARTFLGKHVKNNEQKLAEVISHMAVSPTIDPLAYIEKALQPEKKQVVL